MGDLNPFHRAPFEVFTRTCRYRLRPESRAGTPAPVEHEDLEDLLRVAQAAGQLDLASRSLGREFTLTLLDGVYRFEGAVLDDPVRCEGSSLLQVIVDAHRAYDAAVERRIR